MYAGVAATGASERSWKEFGRIMRPERSRLKKDNFHKLVFSSLNAMLSDSSPMANDILTKMFEVESGDDFEDDGIDVV